VGRAGVAAVVAALALGACRHSSRGGTGTTRPAPGGRSPITGAPTRDTVAGIAPDASGTDCGRITPSGWPTTTAPSPAAMTCLRDAWRAGTAAHLVEVSYASGGSGGSPEYRHVLTYQVTGVRRLRVTNDRRDATAGSTGISVDICTGLAGDLWPEVSGCTPA
jgi:hypothetical protein